MTTDIENCLPIVPDDDHDFTPEIARKIITSYQMIINDLRAELAVKDGAVVVVKRFGPYGYLVIPEGLGEDHWRLEDSPETYPGYASIALFADVDPFSSRPTPHAESVRADFTSRAYRVICDAAGSNQSDWSEYDHGLLDLAREADAALAAAPRSSLVSAPSVKDDGLAETAFYMIEMAAERAGNGPALWWSPTGWRDKWWLAARFGSREDAERMMRDCVGRDAKVTKHATIGRESKS